MSGPLLPERLEELMAGYVLGNLSSEEAEQLRQLLTEQPEVATEVYRLQEVLEAMPYALPEVAPPQHLRLAIMETASAGQKPNPVLKGSPLLWSGVIGSVAALLALALGLDNYSLRQQVTTLHVQLAQQKDVIAMLQEPNTHLVSLKGMSEASTASGNIVMTNGEPKAVLILQNLPILPKGQFYQLWSVVNDEKIPWEQFNVSKQGTVFVKLHIPTHIQGTEFVVTIETLPIPSSPSGAMVMTGTL